MKIYLNDGEHTLSGSTIQDLTRELGLSPEGCAIAVGTKVIPQDQWPEFRLSEGDRVTLIRAAQGG